MAAMKCTTQMRSVVRHRSTTMFTSRGCFLRVARGQSMNTVKVTNTRHQSLLMDSFDLKLPIHLAKTFLELHCKLRLLLLTSFLYSLSFIEFTLHCDLKALPNFSSSLSFTLHKLSLHPSPPPKISCTSNSTVAFRS